MKAGVIDWAVQSCALPGQRQSGDRHVVLATPTRVLTTVVDGVGHGDEAAAAAESAIAEIGSSADDESLVSVVRRCHAKLRDTRGAALSLALFDAQTPAVTWIGVGNISGVVLRSKTGRAATLRKSETLLLRSGVVGKQLPPLFTSSVPVTTGDVLVFATDGIEPEFVEYGETGRPVQQIADTIMERYSKRNDDALVLVARYVG